MMSIVFTFWRLLLLLLLLLLLKSHLSPLSFFLFRVFIVMSDVIPLTTEPQSHVWNQSKQKGCNRFVWIHSSLFRVTQPPFKTQGMIQLHNAVYWTAANPLMAQWAGCKQNDLTVMLHMEGGECLWGLRPCGALPVSLCGCESWF